MKLKKESFVSALELPKDLFLGAAFVTVVGRGAVTIENHKGILEYGPECIRILSGQGHIRVTGKHLTISYFNREAMKIEGRIFGVFYE